MGKNGIGIVISDFSREVKKGLASAMTLRQSDKLKMLVLVSMRVTPNVD
jgi:hypothetical protein